MSFSNRFWDLHGCVRESLECRLKRLEWRGASDVVEKIFLDCQHCHNFRSSCFVFGSIDSLLCAGRRQLSVESNRLTHLFRALRKRDIVQLSPHRVQCKSGEKFVRETKKQQHLETAGRVVFLTAQTYKGHLWFWLGSRKISLFFGLGV